MNKNEISVFNHQQFGNIRVLRKGDELWFVGKEVCDCLGIANSRDALAGLDDDERGVGNTDALGENRVMTTVSEAGMYSLIFRSRKPEAKAFKRWVTHEVLPAIRKDGGYVHVTQEDDDLTILTKACRILQTANEKLQARLTEAEPKLALADSYLTEGSEISVGSLSKKLRQEGIDVGQNRLFEILRNKGVLISRPGVNFNTPTQKYTSRGWFKIIQPPAPQGEKWKPQIRVTPKGVNDISKRMHELFGADME